MATKPAKKKARREDPEAVPDPFEKNDAAEAVEDDPDDDGPSIKRRVGRPRKQKVKVKLPAATRRALALAPLRLPQTIAGVVTGGQMTIAFDKDALEGLVEAFDTLLESVDLELSPGWAYVGAILTCASTGKLVPNPNVKVEQDGAAPPAPAPAAPAEKPVAGSATVVKFEKKPEGTDAPPAAGAGSGQSASA